MIRDERIHVGDVVICLRPDSDLCEIGLAIDRGVVPANHWESDTYGSAVAKAIRRVAVSGGQVWEIHPGGHWVCRVPRQQRHA